MRLREGLAILVTAGVIAACSGSGPGATTDGNGNGQPTDAAQPTADDGGPGNNGGPDFTYGKVTYEISGPVEASGELGFIPFASIFGGSSGTSLNFTDNVDENGSLLTVTVDPEGAVVVIFYGSAATIPAANCETSNWNLGATSASGSFDCTAELVMLPSGAMVQNGRITGSFNAHG